MHSLSPNYLARLQFTGQDLATIRRLGEARGKQELFIQQTPEQLETLRTAAIIQSSESSNRIEGVVAAEGRVAELVLNSAAAVPRDRSEGEIAGYRDVLKLIHESHADIPFRPNVVLQLHRTLFSYQNSGGRWKAADNAITETHSDGSTRVRFVPTPAFATRDAMEQLAEFYHGNAARAEDQLVTVPLVILDFLCIHPFSDGNGRISRLLTLLLLYQAGYRLGRYISLERVIEDSKESYYEALGASSQGWHEAEHDPFPWLRYFWGTLLRASSEFEQRVERLQAGQGGKTEQVRDAVERRWGSFTTAEIEEACPMVSKDMVRHVLRQMRDEGLIASQGRGRGAHWVRATPTIRSEA